MEIRLSKFGTVKLAPGIPSNYLHNLLPFANTGYAQGPFGTVIIQQIQSAQYFLRHFIVVANEVLSFSLRERENVIQSIISLKGNFAHTIAPKQHAQIGEKEFVLFNANGSQECSILSIGKVCSLLHMSFNTTMYQDMLSLFPVFQHDIKKHVNRAKYFNGNGTPARFSIHDAIQSFWIESYIGELQGKYIELRIKASLFTMLAQTYSKREVICSADEKKLSAEALQIISSDITKHHKLTELASRLHCSPSWLKNAFRKVYGIGMFHYLRKTRMEKARSMLLAGQPLKVVALEVGMKPQNFPKEFKSFFGYTVTSLKKGL